MADTTSTYVGWNDANGYHFVAQGNFGSGPETLWSIHSHQWRSWEDGAAAIAQAVLGDGAHEGDHSSLRDAFARTLSQGAGDKAGWFFTDQNLRVWLRSAIADKPQAMTVRPRGDAASWARRAEISAQHNASPPKRGGATSVIAGGKIRTISETKRSRLRTVNVESTIDIAALAAASRQRFVSNHEQMRRVSASGATVTGGKRKPSAAERQGPAPSRPRSSRSASGNGGSPPPTARGKEAVSKDDAQTRQWYEPMRGERSLFRQGDFPKNPHLQKVIFNAMAKLADDLKGGVPRKAQREGVNDVYYDRVGIPGGKGEYRLAYAKHEGGFVALGVLSKGKDRDQDLFFEACQRRWDQVKDPSSGIVLTSMEIGLRGKGVGPANSRPAIQSLT